MSRICKFCEQPKGQNHESKCEKFILFINEIEYEDIPISITLNKNLRYSYMLAAIKTM